MGSRRTTGRALAAAALAAAVLASGCGSSSSPPLTRAQLVEKANSICRRVAAKIEAAGKGQSVSTPQQIASLAGRLAGFEQAALDELGKLVPPAAMEADWKRFVAGAQSLAEDTASLGEVASTKDEAQAKHLIQSASNTQQQMAAIAKRNGLKSCEQVP